VHGCGWTEAAAGYECDPRQQALSFFDERRHFPGFFAVFINSNPPAGCACYVVVWPADFRNHLFDLLLFPNTAQLSKLPAPISHSITE